MQTRSQTQLTNQSSNTWQPKTKTIRGHRKQERQITATSTHTADHFPCASLFTYTVCTHKPCIRPHLEATLTNTKEMINFFGIVPSNLLGTQKQTALKVLNLEFNEEITAGDINHFCNTLPFLINLTTLKLCLNMSNIPPYILARFGEVIKQLPKLQKLEAHLGLRSSILYTFCNSLIRLKQLSTLIYQVQGHLFGEMHILLNNLYRLKNLTHLDLSGCKLRDIGIKKLITHFGYKRKKTNTVVFANLQHLLLAQVLMTHEGFKDLLYGIQCLPRLTTLCASHNPHIGSIGFKHLSELPRLRFNYLQSIDLRNSVNTTNTLAISTAQYLVNKIAFQLKRLHINIIPEKKENSSTPPADENDPTFHLPELVISPNTKIL